VKDKIVPPRTVPDMHDIDEVIDLGIDYRSFDPARALTLEQARPLVLGRKGPVVIESLRNWCRRGVRIDRSILFFPAVLLNSQYRTMPEWVERFEEARREPAGRPRGRRLEPPLRTQAARERRTREALEREGFTVRVDDN
jgi:hypothetical protein